MSMQPDLSQILNITGQLQPVFSFKIESSLLATEDLVRRLLYNLAFNRFFSLNPDEIRNMCIVLELNHYTKEGSGDFDEEQWKQKNADFGELSEFIVCHKRIKDTQAALLNIIANNPFQSSQLYYNDLLSLEVQVLRECVVKKINDFKIIGQLVDLEQKYNQEVQKILAQIQNPSGDPGKMQELQVQKQRYLIGMFDAKISRGVIEGIVSQTRNNLSKTHMLAFAYEYLQLIKPKQMLL